MKKIIVTHTNPDQDAIGAVWLIKRFLKEWEKAELYFVPAGKNYEPENKTDELIHVDTGFGDFDHHQTDKDTCAAKLVFEYLLENEDLVANAKSFKKEALERLVNVINDIDHFRQVYYPDANNDRYNFLLVSILDGLNLVYNEKGNGDIQVTEFGLEALDGIYQVLKNKVRAEKEIEETENSVVKTKWGRAIGFETGNDAVLKTAQKMGYKITVRKDPGKGYVRIKALPDAGIDLTSVYEKLKKMDPEATWFLHISRTMLLNGSTKDPDMKPTKLSLEEIMKIIKNQ